MYSRLKHKDEEIDGHVVLRKYGDVEMQAKDIEKEYEIKQNKIKLVLVNEEELQEFKKNHGDHMLKVLDRTVTTKRKRELFFKLGGHKFTSGGGIRAYCKKILLRYKNWAALNPSDTEFMMEIVGWHPKESKKGEVESFTVGPHPDYPDSKCF